MDPLNLGPFASQMPQMADPLPSPNIKRGGMFAGDAGKNALMGALMGFMSRRNPQMTAALMQMMQQKQQQALDEAQYQRHRQDQFGDWRQQYDYKLGHPEPAAPTEFEKLLAARGYKPGSPEYNGALDNYLNYRQSPDQLVNVPGVGLVQVPRNGAPQAPTAPVGKLTPLGAGGPGASPGGFQY